MGEESKSKFFYFNYYNKCELKFLLENKDIFYSFKNKI